MDMAPLIVLLIFFWVIRTISQAAKQIGKNAGGKPAAKAPKPAPQPESTLGPAMEARMQREFPHLYQQQAESSEVSSLDYGSMAFESTEGVDPCHDDLDHMPLGSLGEGSLEGEDPCHDDWHPLAEEESTVDALPPETGGLDLRWTGDEMVKGFVYGEILRRKVS